MSPPCIYTPPPNYKSYLSDYRSYINKNYETSLKTYNDLHNFSIQRPNDFWTSLWDFLPVKASVQPIRGVDESIPIDKIPKFYDRARLNYAENILSQTGKDIAVTEISETNLFNPKHTSWDELREHVRVFSDALKASDFKQGDVVCCIGKSSVTSLALNLATASHAGIFASFATDAGERVLLDRVGQLNPRFMFAEPSYRYNGKKHTIVDRVRGVWDAVGKPDGAELVCTSTEETPDGWVVLDDFVRRGKGTPLEFKQVPFHTPMVVMFSSGTTGEYILH